MKQSFRVYAFSQLRPAKVILKASLLILICFTWSIVGSIPNYCSWFQTKTHFLWCVWLGHGSKVRTTGDKFPKRWSPWIRLHHIRRHHRCLSYAIIRLIHICASFPWSSFVITINNIFGLRHRRSLIRVSFYVNSTIFGFSFTVPHSYMIQIFI